MNLSKRRSVVVGLYVHGRQLSLFVTHSFHPFVHSSFLTNRPGFVVFGRLRLYGIATVRYVLAAKEYCVWSYGEHCP